MADGIQMSANGCGYTDPLRHHKAFASDLNELSIDIRFHTKSDSVMGTRPFRNGYPPALRGPDNRLRDRMGRQEEGVNPRRAM